MSEPFRIGAPPLEVVGHATLSLFRRTAVRARSLVERPDMLGQLLDDALIGLVRGVCECASNPWRPIHELYACRMRATRFSASKKPSHTLLWLASVFLPAAVTL